MPTVLSVDPELPLREQLCCFVEAFATAGKPSPHRTRRAAPRLPANVSGRADARKLETDRKQITEAEQRQREREEREAAEARKAQEAERAAYCAKHGWPT